MTTYLSVADLLALLNLGERNRAATVRFADGWLAIGVRSGTIEAWRRWPSDADDEARLVSVALLRKAVRGQETVALAPDPRGVSVAAGALTIHIGSDGAMLGPSWLASTEVGVDVPADDLLPAMTWAAAAMAPEDTTYGLAGMDVDHVDGHPLLVTTDGNRLHAARCDALADVHLPRGNSRARPKVPSREWISAVLAMAKPGETIRVVVADPVVSASGRTWSVRGRLWETDWPDWRKVVPGTFTPAGTLRIGSDWIPVLDQFAELSSNAAKAVVLEAGDGTVRLSLMGRWDPAKAEATLPAEVTGTVVKHGVNATYLVDLLRGGEAHVCDNAGIEAQAVWIVAALQMPASVRLPANARHGEAWDVRDPDDEIVGTGFVHVERMDRDHLWIGLGSGEDMVHLNVVAVIPKRRKRPVLVMRVERYS